MSHDLFNLGNLPPQPLPKINLEYGHFFISKEEFLLRTNEICDSLEKIKGFVCFAVQNHHKIIERQFMEIWNILLRFCQNF